MTSKAQKAGEAHLAWVAEHPGPPLPDQVVQAPAAPPPVSPAVTETEQQEPASSALAVPDAAEGVVWTREHARERVMDAYRGSVEWMIETGRRLNDAALFLPHGQYGPFVADDLPFGEDMAMLYRKIADTFTQVVESKSERVRVLPASVGALAMLAAAPADALAEAIDGGQVTPEMTRHEAQFLSWELGAPKPKMPKMPKPAKKQKKLSGGKQSKAAAGVPAGQDDAGSGEKSSAPAGGDGQHWHIEDVESSIGRLSKNQAAAAVEWREASDDLAFMERVRACLLAGEQPPGEDLSEPGPDPGELAARVASLEEQLAGEKQQHAKTSEQLELTGDTIAELREEIDGLRGQVAQLEQQLGQREDGGYE